MLLKILPTAMHGPINVADNIANSAVWAHSCCGQYCRQCCMGPLTLLEALPLVLYGPNVLPNMLFGPINTADNAVWAH